MRSENPDKCSNTYNSSKRYPAANSNPSVVMDSDLLLGLGIASLAAGVATLTAGAALKWLTSTPPLYDDYAQLIADLPTDRELSNIVIQGEIVKHTDRPNSNETAMIKNGPAGFMTCMGKATRLRTLWQKIVTIPEHFKDTNSETAIPDLPLTFSVPFKIRDAKGNPITVEKINMSQASPQHILHHDVQLHSREITHDSPLSYTTHSDVKYNILLYGTTVAILGDAKKRLGNNEITFYPKEVGNNIESFTSTIKLYKGTDLVLIIGGLTSAVLVITGIGLILWMLNRRRQARNETGPIRQ